MAELLESTAERLVLKFYADEAIDAGAEAVPATDPGTAGGQVLRHVSHNLSLQKEAYTADEVRTDQMRPMEKQGTKRVPATINGLLSPLTYADILEAILGGTWDTTVVATSNTTFTSVAADNPTSTFIFTAGDPVASGYGVGQIVQFANLSDSDNNGVNYLIIGFSGASNRTMEVYPAPDTMGADAAFTLTQVGGLLSMPTSNHVRRKAALEVYNSDGDISRLFTEGRFAGFNLQVAPNQIAQIDFSGMWRNRVSASGASAPFFTAPTVETTTDVIDSMDGFLRINGAVVGITTGVSLSFIRAPQAPAQLNSEGLVAGINLANAVLTGEFTIFLTDATFLTAFDDETEFELMCKLPLSDSDTADCMVFYLPRIKINSNTETIIEGAKALQCGFTAARYLGSSPGVPATLIQIADTLVTT